MADTFREIERGYEAKYKLDEELHFKAQCRRNRLLGKWAAERMGVTGAKAEDYARALVRYNLEAPGSDPVIDKIIADFEGAGVRFGTHDVVAAFERFQHQALDQITADYPQPLDVDHIQIGG